MKELMEPFRKAIDDIVIESIENDSSMTRREVLIDFMDSLDEMFDDELELIKRMLRTLIEYEIEQLDKELPPVK